MKEQYTPEKITTVSNIRTPEQYEEFMLTNIDKIYAAEIKCLKHMIEQNIKTDTVAVKIYSKQTSGDIIIEPDAVERVLNKLLAYYTEKEDALMCCKTNELRLAYYTQQEQYEVCQQIMNELNK